MAGACRLGREPAYEGMAEFNFQRLLARGFDLLGPGVDPFLVALLRRMHFPAARLWAAANASAGDYAALTAGLPEAAQKRAEGALAKRAYEILSGAREAAAEATDAWRETAFGGADGDPASAERTRRRAASAHLAAQAPFAAAIGRRGLPLVDWSMLSPGAAPPPPAAAAFAAPLELGITGAGAVYREGDLMRQWLSAPAETGAAGDVAYARASWPVEGDVRGVVVAGSGVGVEWDLYIRMREDFDFAATFSKHGLAVVEMVSPGHGLRVAANRYGGEAFFAGAPTSSAAMLAAQCRETARWLAWSRQRWARPVGVFGISMSSFAAQLVLGHSGAWPDAARPDAGFLIAHSGDLLGVVNGRLAKALGIREALASAGWAEQDLLPWREALAPPAEPAVSPDRIVSVIGRLDRVTPYVDGRALAQSWRLPQKNRFRLPHGHMGLPTRVRMHDAPTEHFADVLAAAGR